MDLTPELLTEQDFLDKAPVGTTIYVLESMNEKPMGVSERKITHYALCNCSIPNIDGKLQYWYDQGKYKNNEAFVSDSTNRWHGAFLNKEKAEALHVERYKQFEALVAAGVLDEHGRTDFDRAMDKYDDYDGYDCYDDDYDDYYDE